MAPMMKNDTENVYTLPDGKKISVTNEREKLLDCVFDTSLYNAIDFFNSKVILSEQKSELETRKIGLATELY